MSKSKTTKTKGRKRHQHEKKPVRKGIKSLRGKPEIYDELKKVASFSITPTAINGLRKISSELNLSRSELIERIGRGVFALTEVKTETENESNIF
jgi:hypothetical protein